MTGDRETAPTLLQISGLGIGFTARSGATRAVLRDIDLAVHRGETVGLVGESGSGKSTLALAAMGYLRPGLRVLDGVVRFDGIDLFTVRPSVLEGIRGGRLALIPQNAGQSLTPTLRVGRQLEEALRLHGKHPAHEHGARVLTLIERVRLPSPEVIASRYPHELSGGQQQRIAIAMALAGEPELLLLDEPTTGLDVTTQAHILTLLDDLARETGTAMVYVSHDLGAIARVCRRVVVLYAGEIVADGPTRQVLVDPTHPYARGLLASIPRIGEARLPIALEGRPPSPGGAGAGCAFVDRCALAAPICRTTHPALERAGAAGFVRCHRWQEAGSIALAPPPGPPRQAPDMTEANSALRLDRLAISYARPGFVDQVLGRRPTATPTVEGISLDIRTGEAMALIGESGSGKSSILKAITGLVAHSDGVLTLGGDQILPAAVDRRRPDQRRRIQLVFQNPDDSLNPRHTVLEQLAQPLGLYFGLSGLTLRERAARLLDQVRLGAHYLDRLPDQLSGGEKQRVAIARAFAAEPDIVLCDEVTSALDVSVQAAVLRLLDALRRERQTTYLFVSHDLAVVRAIADRVAVLYQGRLCEVGSAADVYAIPMHPYTEALLGAVLEPTPDAAPRILAADIVELAPPAQGCPFQRRCHRRIGPICDEATPPARLHGSGHVIHCHIPLDALEVAQAAETGRSTAPERRP